MADSVVKLAPDLSKVLSYFTPGSAQYGRAVLEQDNDFGAGGALVLPAQPGAYPNLAVAAGKIGPMYLMNLDNLGGYHAGADKVLGSVNIGNCWCGQSYYQGADGIGRIVSSGGNKVMVWKVETSATQVPALVQESISTPLATGQDSGFFTTVSSNGTLAGSQIIWALSRPDTFNPAAISLYAFDPSAINPSGQSMMLYSGFAGIWPNGDGNANLVPVVANGRVFVASYKELTIFGLGSALPPSSRVAIASDGMSPPPAAADAPHAVYGRLVGRDDTILEIETRSGKRLRVDTTAARETRANAFPVVGRSILASGDYDDRGVLHAVSVQRVKDEPALWRMDR
jgi:hypothetical protein